MRCKSWPLSFDGENAFSVDGQYDMPFPGFYGYTRALSKVNSIWTDPMKKVQIISYAFLSDPRQQKKITVSLIII